MIVFEYELDFLITLDSSDSVRRPARSPVDPQTNQLMPGSFLIPGINPNKIPLRIPTNLKVPPDFA